MDSRVAAFIARRWSVPETKVRVDLQPLQGGLESSVTLARVSADMSADTLPSTLVVKELRGRFEREAEVYDLLWRHLVEPPAVRAFGREVTGNTTYLYMDQAHPCASWPWSDPTLAAVVCRQLARLHDTAALEHARLRWDYETELAMSAGTTLDAAAGARDSDGRRYWRRLGDLRRVVTALPAIRSRLLAGETTVIHGDVHPGNVVLVRQHPEARIVLIDWARARVGSPIEDIASWLHALGCWEPQARRRHDTLMRAYLEARRRRRAFCADVRMDFWLASVSNGLAGAIRYHLAVLTDRESGDSARFDATRALSAWQRVVRRASTIS